MGGTADVLSILDLAVREGLLTENRADALRRQHAELLIPPTPNWLVDKGVLTRSQLAALRGKVDQSGSAGWNSSSLPSPSWDEVPQQIGRYRILDKIGSGAMGVVYRAEDPILGVQVAIKVLPEDEVSNRERRRRFLEEARNAALLRDHVNIVTVYEAGMRPRPYIAMQYVRGATLSALIADPGRTDPGVPPAEAFDYARQVACGLAEAHSHPVIHRDIKPKNIMVTGKIPKTVKILDFGIAKNIGLDAETTGGIGGTLPYMPPEILAMALGQASARRDLMRSPSIDVYALGVTLWEMLASYNPWQTARTPAELLELKRAVGDCSDLPSLPQEVSDDAKRTIGSMLTADHAARCPDGAAAYLALDKLPDIGASSRSPASAARQTSPGDNAFLEEYRFADRSMKLYMGDITDLSVDAIVSSDDNHVSMGGGVSCRILRAGGRIIEEEAHEQLPAAMGDVLVTNGGRLHCRYVFHCLVIDLDNMLYPTLDVVARCVGGVFQKARRLGIVSIAFPALATGSAALALKDVTRVMLSEITRRFCAPDCPVREITLAFLKEDSFAGFVRSEILEIMPGEVTVQRAADVQRRDLWPIIGRKQRGAPQVIAGQLVEDPFAEQYHRVSPLYSRPESWHCIYCGWRSEEAPNDYLCRECGRTRPFLGGSASIRVCEECNGPSLAIALFCEWCGASVAHEVPLPPLAKPADPCSEAVDSPSSSPSRDRDWIRQAEPGERWLVGAEEYEIVRTVLVAEMGWTYEATHTSSGKRVFLTQGSWAPRDLSRFDQEIGELKHLSGHDSLIPVLESG